MPLRARPADQLAAVADASVDAVTARSVLIYVKDKAQAMREFFRVLRPGGRVEEETSPPDSCGKR